MKTSRIISALVGILFMSIMLYSCEKESNLQNSVVSEAEESGFVDNTFESVIDDVDIITGLNDGAMSKSSDHFGPHPGNHMPGDSCAQITVEYPDGTPFPRIITVDFGSGCTRTFNGETITKSGQIVISVTAPMFEAGSVRTVTFVNFTINDNLIEGKQIITNSGLNDKNQPVMVHELENGQITTPEGAVIERSHIRTRTMIEGFTTPREHMDDVFAISGSGFGINSDGVAYTNNITSELLLSHACPWFKQGIVQHVTETDTIVINFGDGNCDNIATKSINGSEPEEFELARKHQRKDH